MKALAQTFKALSDETRLLCLALLLVEKELCVCDFENALQTTQSKTSRHLRYLLNTGLVSDRREGIWIHYRIAENLSFEQRKILDVVASLKSHNTVKLYIARLREFKKQKTSGLNCG